MSKARKDRVAINIEKFRQAVALCYKHKGNDDDYYEHCYNPACEIQAKLMEDGVSFIRILEISNEVQNLITEGVL